MRMSLSAFLVSGLLDYPVCTVSHIAPSGTAKNARLRMTLEGTASGREGVGMRCASEEDVFVALATVREELQRALGR